MGLASFTKLDETRARIDFEESGKSYNIAVSLRQRNKYSPSIFSIQGNETKRFPQSSCYFEQRNNKVLLFPRQWR